MDETIEGYMALCICILCNVPPDVAFRCYETGRANVAWTHEDMQKIKALRQDGTKWQDIADEFCVDKGKLMKIYSYYKRKAWYNVKFKLNAFYNMDCMEALRNIEDKYFDLAIVDPPYFSGPERREFFGRSVSPIGVQRLYRESEKWSVPTTEYFDELFRVSKNQIIWGCNYFDYQFGPGRIVWDKCNGTSSFSDAEIAYCSMHDSVRLYRYMWNGMFQGKSMMRGDIQQGNKALNEKRIHPTQKPVNLYKWLLTKYAKLGDKILDTHVGSGSSLIACCDLGYEYLGFEIDEGYFNAAAKRIEEFNAQTRIQIEQMEMRV